MGYYHEQLKAPEMDEHVLFFTEQYTGAIHMNIIDLFFCCSVTVQACL